MKHEIIKDLNSSVVLIDGIGEYIPLTQHDKEVEALRAQVEQLREVLRYADNKLYILTHNRKDVSPRLLTDADKGYKAVHEAVLGFEDNLNVFVAKRDAEIKAQAGRDGYQACVDALGEAAQNAMDNGDTSLVGCIGDLESYTTVLNSEHYYNQLRQQAAKE